MKNMSITSEENTPTVIIADDSPEIVMVLKKTLEVCDCNVVATAEDGEQAIELIHQHKPDMVFLDIEMPNKNGFDVLDAIKNSKLKIFSVMVSGHSSKENLTASLKRGVQGFIVKPHNQKKVEEVVASYLVSLNK